jgi:glycyl-tRNA synthetase
MSFWGINLKDKNMTVDLKDIMALSKRRGFVFQASEIYGGINGFWDYGPLGVELKNNIRDAWWRAMVLAPPIGPDGMPVQIVGLDASIIQNPKSWEASGHVGGFNDPMVDCKETKSRYRADHINLLHMGNFPAPTLNGKPFYLIAFDGKPTSEDIEKRLKKINISKEQRELLINSPSIYNFYDPILDIKNDPSKLLEILAPGASEPGTLTEPKQFNMMFHTFVGAAAGDDNKAYLRPETCGPIFLNFNNVVDSSRVSMPFGIAQIGKAFRNEVTPRNFVFRSREFEQMELEWFCKPEESMKWFEFWLEQRKAWWKAIGMDMDKFYFNEIDKGELAHYSQRTVDLEYEFPFTSPGHGELEGIAHRGDFDLTQHQEFSGTKLEYRDPVTNEKFMPHVIEPSTGLTRAFLAVMCGAYTIDENRPSGMYLKFHPSIAPKKAAILPLTAKGEHPEIATKLYLELRKTYNIDLDIKQNIGKRYARQDEIGTPYCFTIDDTTVSEGTVTVRDRDTTEQHRIKLEDVKAFLDSKIQAN